MGLDDMTVGKPDSFSHSEIPSGYGKLTINNRLIFLAYQNNATLNLQHIMYICSTKRITKDDT